MTEAALHYDIKIDGLSHHEIACLVASKLVGKKKKGKEPRYRTPAAAARGLFDEGIATSVMTAPF